MGRQHEIAGELAELVVTNPLRERLVGQLMVALHRTGRQIDALAVYRRPRTDLAEELGVEPGAELCELHRAILTRQPVATIPSPVLTRAPVVPAQLPADVAGFAGREPQLRALGQALHPVGWSGDHGATIAAVSGTAGVGKTALAVHWAHRVRDEFPDGQLFVNFGGHGPDAPMPPERALSLPAVARRAPGGGPDGRPECGRPLPQPARRRVLVVLDNAADVDQIIPLLPGTAGCMALVTSRDQLGGLAAAFGARLLTLGTVVEDEARAILMYRIGADRMAAEPLAVTTIVIRPRRR